MPQSPKRKKLNPKWCPPWPDEAFVVEALKRLRLKGATAPEQELRDQIDMAYRNTRDRLMKQK